MLSGGLTDLLNIEQFTVTGTGTRGEPLGSWQTLYSAVPANVTVLSGRKLVLAKELFPTAQYSVQIRWIDGINVTQRCHVYYRGHLRNPQTNLLLYVGHINDNDELELTCEATEATMHLGVGMGGVAGVATASGISV